MSAPISTAEISPTPASRRYAIVLAALLLGIPIIAVALRASVSMRESQSTVPTPRTTTDNRLNLSVAYINAKAPEQAIPILLSLVADDKNNAMAWNNLCVAHNLQKDYMDGATACRKALGIDPHFQLAANNLKWAMDEQKKTEQQLAAGVPLSQAKTPTPSPESVFYLAQGLHQLNAGDYDAAIDSWQKILAVDPSNALAANNIGTAYMFKKEPVSALKWFQRAAKSDPSLQIARNNIAWATGEQAKTSR